MKYNGKYSIKKRLHEKQKKGASVANTAGIQYEIDTTANLNQIFATIPKFSGSFASNQGTKGADVEIKLFVAGTTSQSKIVPIECKTSLSAKFGNASISYTKGGVDGDGNTVLGFYGWGPRTMSKMQIAIKAEIQLAMDNANKNQKALAICDKISFGPLSLSSAGCGVKTQAPSGTINKWYGAKSTQGADYIQIKGHGLYLMPGSKDSLGLDSKLKAAGVKIGLPVFRPKKEHITVRHKQNTIWKPIAELACSGLVRSPISLDDVSAMIKLLK